jgi:hypothetical protein
MIVSQQAHRRYALLIRTSATDEYESTNFQKNARRAHNTPNPTVRDDYRFEKYSNEKRGRKKRKNFAEIENPVALRRVVATRTTA